MRNRKAPRLRWIAMLLLATAAVATAVAAQEVKDLTASDPTEEQLITILQPKEEADGVRGLTRAQPRAKCSLKHEEGSRGLTYQPISDIAAIRVGFAYDSAEILPAAIPALDTLGRALTHPKLSASCFQIMGHTDSTGSDTYNDRLSQRRAEAVRRYLATHFNIEPNRLDALGLGKNQPIDDNATPEGRSHNRRVEVVNVGS